MGRGGAETQELKKGAGTPRRCRRLFVLLEGLRWQTRPAFAFVGIGRTVKTTERRFVAISVRFTLCTSDRAIERHYDLIFTDPHYDVRLHSDAFPIAATNMFQSVAGICRVVCTRFGCALLHVR